MRVNDVYEGDCLDVMREFPDNCIDSIITDPPYGLFFMGKNWDYGLPGEAYWREALRVAKPGATLLAFGGSRTHHRLTCAIEDAGWEIRDCICWLYGSGFPKSTDISKQLDKAAIVDCQYCNGSGKGRPSYMIFCPEHGEIMGDNDLCPVCDSEVEEIELEREPCKYCGGSGKVRGAEREVVGIDENYKRRNPNGMTGTFRLDGFTTLDQLRNAANNGDITPNGRDAGKTLLRCQREMISNGIIAAPATPLAAKFNGYGTALKPAVEYIVMAMKPIDGTFAANAEKWGVSGIWVDGGRVGENPGYKYNAQKNGTIFHGEQGERIRRTAQKNGGSFIESSKGRWPANVIHDGSEEVMAEFDKAGVRTSGARNGGAGYKLGNYEGQKGHWGLKNNYPCEGSQGSAARYFAQCPPDPPQPNPCLDCTDCIIETEAPKGRWPANVIHDGSEEVMAEFDKADTHSAGKARNATQGSHSGKTGIFKGIGAASMRFGDSGSAARYFAQCPPDPTAHPEAARFKYCPKASKRERGAGNTHPTVKPLSLLRYLAKLTRPPDGGIVLDPFAGSGTTALACIAEGRDYIIIEKEPEYADLCRRRIAEYSGAEVAPVEHKVTESETVKQMSLW